MARNHAPEPNSKQLGLPSPASKAGEPPHRELVRRANSGQNRATRTSRRSGPARDASGTPRVIVRPDSGGSTLADRRGRDGCHTPAGCRLRPLRRGTGTPFPCFRNGTFPPASRLAKSARLRSQLTSLTATTPVSCCGGIERNRGASQSPSMAEI